MRFQFSDCMLDLERRELTRGAVQVSIAPRAFDLLAYLVENRERVVSKSDLLDAVWGKRIVSESTLTSHINAVRKAIGDSGGEQALVRTIARKGFRFIGDVTDVTVAEPAAVEKGLHVPRRSPRRGRRIGRRLPFCRFKI